MKSGIYKILNLKNNNFYIGSSIDLRKRFSEHRRSLNKNKHHSYYLQSAWNKYGENNFEFIILEFVSRNRLKKREQYYLDKLFPVYNMSKSATSPMLGRKHSEKTKRKFRKIKRPSGKNHCWYGKTFSKQHIEKMTKAKLGSKRSEKTKRKMSRTSKRLNRFKDILPYIISKRRKIIDSNQNVFESMTSCATFWKISIATVCDILKGRHSKTRKGISFQYFGEKKIKFKRKNKKRINSLSKNIYFHIKRKFYYKFSHKGKYFQKQGFKTEKEAIIALNKKHFELFGIKYET